MKLLGLISITLIVVYVIYFRRMTAWILFKLGYLEKKCNHPYHTIKRYFSLNGTPMVYFNCHICGYNYTDHVHGDPEQMKKDGDWPYEEYLGEYVHYINGKKVA